MKKKIVMIVVLLASMTSLFASNDLTAPAVTIPQGGTGDINVVLNNDKAYTAFTLKLTLPDGISYDSFTKSSRFADSHSVSATPNGQVISFGCLSTSNENISGNSGTLITVTISADQSLEVGSEHVAVISNAMFSTTSGDEPLDNVNITITIGEPDDGRLKFYETSSTLPSYTAGGTADVTMYRTIKANEWSTIVLPFTLTKAKAEAAFGTDVQLAQFSGFETTIDNDLVPTYIKINFSNYTMNTLSGMKGGTPYLIKTSKLIESFQADNVKLVGEVTAVEKSDPEYNILTGQFTGTFTSSQIPADGLFISDNKFWYSIGNTNVKAFRAWLQLDPILDKQLQIEESRIILNFVENDATGIKDVKVISGDKFYNLSGQQVKNPANGIYVKEGKKVIIK